MKRRATTLIELLIVIAIIAILSSALIAVLIAPMKEQAATDLHAEMERGTMTFFANLTRDIHGAESFIIERDATRLVVTPFQHADSRTIYFVSDQNTLRRWTGAAGELPSAGEEPRDLGAPLVPYVEQLRFTRAEDGASTMSARLFARRESMEQVLLVDRSLTLLTDGAWKGGAP